MNFQDNISFITKLSTYKVSNLLKILLSYFISKYFIKPFQWGRPITVSVEPTTSCNLRCPECTSGLRSFTRDTGIMEMDVFRKTVDEMKDHLMYLYFYFQGEPYLHTGLSEMIKYASDLGIYTVTSTNGHFLDDERAKQTILSGLSRIIISIDGTTQETYASYRIGGDLQKVIDGTKNLVKWKKTLKSSSPHIIFQFLVVKPNEHQIREVYALADEIGVDEVKLKTAQINDFEEGSPLMPTIDKYSRYQLNPKGNYQLKNKLLDHCWKLWHSAVITWDGNVVPCCFDKDASHVMGNIAEQPFNEIWWGEKYHAFRSSLMRSRKEIDICKNCSEGTQVWA